MATPSDKIALEPAAVSRRLEDLRRLWVPMTAAEAERAMTPPPEPETFDAAVARRLEELRALIELTRHLHDRLP